MHVMNIPCDVCPVFKFNVTSSKDPWGAKEGQLDKKIRGFLATLPFLKSNPQINPKN